MSSSEGKGKGKGVRLNGHGQGRKQGLAMNRPQWILWIAAVLLGLAALGVWGCGDNTGDSGREKPRKTKVRKVEVRPVGAMSAAGNIEYVGVLAARKKVSVSSETGGTVERIYFEKGDHVKKGQVLAEISASTVRLKVREAKAAVEAARQYLEKLEVGSRPEEIQMAEAAFREAEAAQQEAEKNFKRIKELFSRKVASQREYDAAERMVETARARLEAAAQRLSLARQGPRAEDRQAARARLDQALAGLALAEDRLEKSILRSPCNGVVAFREVEQGEVIVVPPAKVITQVVDRSTMKIRLSIAEKDIHMLREQKRFPFTVDAIPGSTFFCTLTFISPVGDPLMHSFPVELAVEKPDPRMADGMTVRVSLPVEDDKKAIKVPSSWLSEENGKLGLFVVEEGRARFRKVTLGTYYGQMVEIVSGLNVKDLVITDPSGLHSGDPVEY